MELIIVGLTIVMTTTGFYMGFYFGKRRMKFLYKVMFDRLKKELSQKSEIENKILMN